MTERRRELLDLLRFELEFLEQGGYGRSVRTPWKPKQIFQDSPSCLNFSEPVRVHPCDECLLMDFVPPERRSAEVPCHHIPLNRSGDTIEALFDYRDETRLEDALRDWLRQRIQQLEAEEKAEKEGLTQAAKPAS